MRQLWKFGVVDGIDGRGNEVASAAMSRSVIAGRCERSLLQVTAVPAARYQTHL